MEISVVVGLICTAVGCLVGYFGFVRNKAKDDKTDGHQDGVILTELGYLKSSMDTMNTKLDKQEDRHVEVMTRLAQVEASAKQAHKRLDKIDQSEH